MKITQKQLRSLIQEVVKPDLFYRSEITQLAKQLTRHFEDVEPAALEAIEVDIRLSLKEAIGTILAETERKILQGTYDE